MWGACAGEVDPGPTQCDGLDHACTGVLPNCNPMLTCPARSRRRSASACRSSAPRLPSQARRSRAIRGRHVRTSGRDVHVLFDHYEPDHVYRARRGRLHRATPPRRTAGGGFVLHRADHRAISLLSRHRILGRADDELPAASRQHVPLRSGDRQSEPCCRDRHSHRWRPRSTDGLLGAGDSTATQTLPWVTNLSNNSLTITSAPAGCCDVGCATGATFTPPTSALVSNGAYRVTTTAPVSAYQFNALEYSTTALCPPEPIRTPTTRRCCCPQWH